MRRLGLLVLLLASVLVAGCGESTVDTGKLEDEISKGYEERVAGAKVEEIECPELDAEAGTKGECTATLQSGLQIVMAVNVTDDEGNVRWDAVRGIAPGSVFEAAATDKLEETVDQRPARVGCPERIELTEGKKVRCRVVADDGSTIGATITITSTEGDFDIKVDEEGVTPPG